MIKHEPPLVEQRALAPPYIQAPVPRVTAEPSSTIRALVQGIVIDAHDARVSLEALGRADEAPVEVVAARAEAPVDAARRLLALKLVHEPPWEARLRREPRRVRG